MTPLAKYFGSATERLYNFYTAVFHTIGSGRDHKASQSETLPWDN